MIIQNGTFEVKATAGNTHLGGEDFDNRLVNHFAEEFKRKHKRDLTQNKRALGRLKVACEKVKLTLSASTRAGIAVDSLFEGIDFHSSITRARFEELNSDLFHSTVELLEATIRDANMNKSQIEEVVLVGGSTRIPKVQKLLQEFFDGKKLNMSINPDEAVAYGAAVEASILNGDKSKEIQGIILLDVTPLSLGVSTIGNIMSAIIKKNTPIPAQRWRSYYTVYDDQTSILFKVYEGERAMASDNNYLGEFTVSDIPPAPRGVGKVQLMFEVDVNSILNIKAKWVRGEIEVTIEKDKNQLSADEIERMIKEAEIYKAEDDKRKAAAEAQNSLEFYCYDLRRSVEVGKLKYMITEANQTFILNKCEEVALWLDSNKSAGREEIECKHNQVKSVFNPIIGAFGGAIFKR